MLKKIGYYLPHGCSGLLPQQSHLQSAAQASIESAKFVPRSGISAASADKLSLPRKPVVCGTKHFYYSPQAEDFMSDLIKHISDASFEADVLNSDKPVLVDFWAEWCGPCKMIAPILDDVAKDYQGRLSIVKLNVDDNQAVPAKFGIRGIPTLILFKNGEVAAQKVGALAKGQLVSFIDANI